jgi:radical SAM superfamily enzyme YgiQ (UPF0313 family)
VDFEGHIIRPPSEADSILLEVTVGCSHNACTFCGAYQLDSFREKSDRAITAALAEAAEQGRGQSRVFLCNGDALTLPQSRLVWILAAIRERLPWVTAVSSYASAHNVSRKSDEELAELRALGLRMVHLGLESGDDVTLKEARKRGSAAFIVEQARRVRAASIQVFVTVLLGLAGTERSLVHAEATGRALSRMDPGYVGALTLMLIPGTALFQRWRDGGFEMPSPRGLLEELRALVEHTTLSRGMFYANHASNYLPIRARFPRDKARTLAQIEAALAGELPLRPQWLRGL